MDGQKRDAARRYPNLSRRGFLGIAGAAGSAAALGMPAAWAAGAGTERRSAGRAGPLAAQGTRGDVGATVPEAVYSQPNRLDAAKIFDGYVSPARGARVTQKYYFKESQWPATPLETDITVMYDTAQGGAANFKWIMCFKPARDQVGNTQPTPDQTALLAACNQLTSAGVIFDVVLWQEPNGASSTYFTDGAAYRAYVEFYRPYVPAGIHVIYDCAGSASPGDQQSYFPGNSLVQKVYVDFYGNHYANNLAAGRSDPLATLNNLAISNGVPFGLGEWGYGLSADNALTPTSNPTAGAYVAYLIDVFTARLNAGKTNGAIVYYDGTNPADTWNIIPGPTDWRVALYQELYNALASGNG